MKTQYKLVYAMAFTSENRKRWHDITVDPCGVVRVYDSIMDGYTSCHALSKAEQKTIAESNQKIVKL